MTDENIAVSSNQRSLPALLRTAERRVNEFVFHNASPSFCRIPADRDHDLDLLLCEAADEIERLLRREQELTAQLLESGGELGKVREHNASLRAALRRHEQAPDETSAQHVMFPSEEASFTKALARKRVPETSDGPCCRMCGAEIDATANQVGRFRLVFDMDTAEQQQAVFDYVVSLRRDAYHKRTEPAEPFIPIGPDGPARNTGERGERVHESQKTD